MLMNEVHRFVLLHLRQVGVCDLFTVVTQIWDKKGVCDLFTLVTQIWDKKGVCDLFTLVTRYGIKIFPYIIIWKICVAL
jgi:phosphatidate phosphatase PAH1